MYRQITLEELGVIPARKKEISRDSTDRSKYACFCGGCICLHCANNVECSDNCTGEAGFGCFTCDDCKGWDGKGADNWKHECRQYRTTNTYAAAVRKRFYVAGKGENGGKGEDR